MLVHMLHIMSVHSSFRNNNCQCTSNICTRRRNVCSYRRTICFGRRVIWSQHTVLISVDSPSKLSAMPDPNLNNVADMILEVVVRNMCRFLVPQLKAKLSIRWDCEWIFDACYILRVLVGRNRYRINSIVSEFSSKCRKRKYRPIYILYIRYI